MHLPKNRLALPYKGILLFVIGLAWLFRNLNILKGNFFFPGLGLLLLTFYFLSGSRQSYLISSLIILAISGTLLLPNYTILPPFLEHTLLFFLLGLAFLLIYSIHTRRYGLNNKRWPLVVALAFFLFGLFIYILVKGLLPSTYLARIDLLWPMSLLIIAIYLIVSHLASKKR